MPSEVEIKTMIQAVGRRVSEARERLGLDQQELSNLSGVSRVMLSDFERASRTMSLEHLFRIAEGAHIHATWLVTGDGEMAATGPSIGQIREEAWLAREREFDFISALNSMLRRYRQDRIRRTWAVGACIRAYWGATWLGFEDLHEVAQIIDTVCSQCGLDIIEVLESTAHSNASQYIADWLVHRGVDPEAFGPKLQEGGTYETHYFRNLVRSDEVLHRLAKEKGLTEPQPSPSPMRQAMDYMLKFVRIFDPNKPKS